MQTTLEDSISPNPLITSPEKDPATAPRRKKNKNTAGGGGSRKPASYVSRAALQKTARMPVDKSLPREEQLKQQLAMPELTETDKLMITLKFKNDQRVESRREERQKLLENMRSKKKIVKERAVHQAQMITGVYSGQLV